MLVYTQRQRRHIRVKAWGFAPGLPKCEVTSAESAIRFGVQAESIRQLNRAFSASLHGDLNSGGDAPGSPRRIRPVAD